MAKIGRPKGSLNKRTLDYLEVLEYECFDAAAAMIHCYREAIGVWDKTKKECDQTKKPIPEEAAKYLKIASDNVKEIACYAYPRLKAIERKNFNPLEGMTPEQTLEALEKAAAILKIEMSNGKSSL